MSAIQLMKEVIATGAKFTIEGGTVGLTQPVPDDLLIKLRNSKTEILDKLLQIKRDNKKTSKVWRITIQSGSRIDKMNMIDPDRMSREECERMLIDKFGVGRVIEFTERDI